MKLKINEIVTDAGTQMRAQINEEVVRDYREASGLPPVIVFFDGERYYLADGFHRLEAQIRNGKREIDADVREGSLRKAILYAAGANASHGLRRSNEDKRRAVEALLKDDEWNQWSDAEISRRCGVTHPFVGKLRKNHTCNVTSINGDDSKDNSTWERTFINPKTGQRTTMNTGKIGKPTARQSSPVEIGDTEGVVKEVMTLDKARKIKDKIAVVCGEVTASEKLLLDYVETKNGQPLLRYKQSFKSNVNSIRNYIEALMPYAICFHCHGTGCVSCDDLGYMTKTQHDSRIPDGEVQLVSDVQLV